MRRYLIAIFLAGVVTSGVSAQEFVKFFISTSPEGVVVKRNGEEWGLTGREFSVHKSKLPTADLQLQLIRKNYKPQQLLIERQRFSDKGPDEVVVWPKTPLALEPEHPLVPLQENPLPLLLALGVVGGIGFFVRRNRQLSKTIEDRGSKEERLKDQIKTQHDFAFQTIGQYRILEQLGEGGIAKVFRAVPDDTLDESESVAIKILHSHLCLEPGHRERFIREGRVSLELIHPNVIRLFKIDMDDEIVYLVLELLEGHTLKEEMSGQVVCYSRAREIVTQVFSALEYAHSKGVIHRDLTPSNIMITKSGLKLMDFGLARSREVGHTITVTGVIQGTPGYMAPEQMTETLDARTDQYSLGAILFEMLTGRRPIEREDAMQLIMATFTEDPPNPRDFNPDIPEILAGYILKLLRRKPEDRFPDMKTAASEFVSVWEASGI